MKKILFFVVLAFLLCSCSANAPVNPPAEELPPSPLVPVTEAESSEADDEPVSLYPGLEENLTAYAENAHWLEYAGYSHKASGLVINEDDSIVFDLTITDGKREITKEINGFYLYDADGFKHLEWGGYSFTDNDYLSVCFINGAFVIDLKDFSVLDLEFDFPDNGESDYWINGVIYDEETGWIVSAAEAFSGTEEQNIPWKIFVFDENGSLEKEYSPKSNAPCGGWYNYATLSVAEYCTLFEKDGETCFSFSRRCYYPESGKTYMGSSIASPYKAYADGFALYFYSGLDITNGYRPWDPEYWYDDDLGYYAVLRTEDGKLVDFFSTDENYITDYNHEDELELIHHSGLSFTIKNSRGKSIELDFEKESYTVGYSYTDEHLINHTADSSDGTYSLWEAAIEAGGEAYFYEVALKNNKTGEIKHIAPNGTNIGSHASEGFLKNDDFYVFSTNGFKIYSPENCEVVFDISENFMSEENGGKKIIHTFRRAPDDFSFIVVYSESSGYSNKDIQNAYDTGTMPYTIKLAFLDKDGNLIEDFDSGVFVNASYFGIQTAEMNYSEDEIVLFSDLEGKGYSSFRIVFDLESKTFL